VFLKSATTLAVVAFLACASVWLPALQTHCQCQISSSPEVSAMTIPWAEPALTPLADFGPTINIEQLWLPDSVRQASFEEIPPTLPPKA
jgi:hypothetical protein